MRVIAKSIPAQVDVPEARPMRECGKLASSHAKCPRDRARNVSAKIWEALGKVMGLARKSDTCNLSSSNTGEPR